MARLWNNGENGTRKKWEICPKLSHFSPILPFPTNFTHLLYISHNVFLAISHYSPFPPIPPHFPPFPPISPYFPLFPPIPPILPPFSHFPHCPSPLWQVGVFSCR